MKNLAESEKAVCLSLVLKHFVADCVYAYDVWVPKSQLSADGVTGRWITEQKVEDAKFNHSNRGPALFVAWRDADGVEYEAGRTEREIAGDVRREAAFEAGKASYDKLIEQAKAMGIKGVRVGLKRRTIEDKIAAAC